jgi:hypothetical protein
LIPEKIAFEAANADLLKLLVAPLYGNDPSIGVRELIQNAIDAVREYEDYAFRLRCGSYGGRVGFNPLYGSTSVTIPSAPAHTASAASQRSG